MLSDSSLWETLDDRRIQLLLVTVILIVSFVALTPPPLEIMGVEKACGDGVCEGNETFVNCPEDCMQPSYAGGHLLVSLDHTPSCHITIKAYGPSNELLGTQRAIKKDFVFEGLGRGPISVAVHGPYGKAQELEAIGLEEGGIAVNLELPDGICGVQTPLTGSLDVEITDTDTDEPISRVKVTIAEMRGGQIVNIEVCEIVDGQQSFRLPYDKVYSVFAEKDGYESYDGTKEKVAVVDLGVEAIVQISLRSLFPEPPKPPLIETGELEVCVMNGTLPLASGQISLQGVSGDFLLTGEISEANLATNQTAPGCYVFTDLPAGRIFSISMSSPPFGCIPQTAPMITMKAGQRKVVFLKLDCNASNVGYIRVMFTGRNGEVLTQNAMITLWAGDELIPGRGIVNSLAMGPAGYTEEVTVPANESIYVWAKGLPPGYEDYKSGSINVSHGEHRSVDVLLNYTETAYSSDFTFVGVSAPNSWPNGRDLQITIDKILFDQSELDEDTADVIVTLGPNDCQVTHQGIWRADCTAPDTRGDYRAYIMARHGGFSSSYSLPIAIREYRSGEGLLTIEPTFLPSGDPPLDLYYDIRLQGVPVEDIVYEEMTITYLDSLEAYAGEVSPLSFTGEHWKLTADAPFKGMYEIEMYLEALSNDAVYNASYTLGFLTLSNSEDLKAETQLSESVMMTRDRFTIQVQLKFKGTSIKKLSILELYIDETYHLLPWDRTTQRYSQTIATPLDEMCRTLLNLLINDEEFAKAGEIHVIDISGTKSSVCPLIEELTCGSIEDVRRCAYDYWASSHRPPTQGEMISCIGSGCRLDIAPQCVSKNKGDLIMDCYLDDSDISLFEEVLSFIQSQTDRNSLEPCMDMDNDMDVDVQDLECLKNMVSGKWQGDTGDSTCSKSMKGGFCFDIDTGSSLPGDLVHDENLDEDDETVMRGIVDAISLGVTPDEEILAVADFDKDGDINYRDAACLEDFLKINFSTGDVDSSRVIPTHCMGIFNLDCEGVDGDLNADGEVSDIDLMIINLIASNKLQVTSDIIACADVNQDTIVNEEDIICMEALFFGEYMGWLVCLDCESNTPRVAYGPEICNDGYDNDCDGTKDSGDERCECSAKTPCEMAYDLDGGVSIGVADGNLALCRKQQGETTYQWVPYNALECNADTQCKTMECEDKMFLCAKNPNIGWFEARHKGCIDKGIITRELCPSDSYPIAAKDCPYTITGRFFTCPGVSDPIFGSMIPVDHLFGLSEPPVGDQAMKDYLSELSGTGGSYNWDNDCMGRREEGNQGGGEELHESRTGLAIPGFFK